MSIDTLPASTIAPTRQSWLRPKYLLFGFIAVMAVYVMIKFEGFLIDSKHPEWTHIESFKWWMLIHGLAAGCALILGPMQFSERLRQHYMGLHRVVGRIYVFSVFISAPVGVIIQHADEKLGMARTFTVETMIQSGLWVLTTAIAWVFILNGKVAQHRQWMTRSFGTGPLIFLEVRVILGLGNISDPHLVETVVWICTASSIFIADVVLQVEEHLRSRRARTKIQAAVAVPS
jgi:uncharacterized membrane protein